MKKCPKTQCFSKNHLGLGFGNFARVPLCESFSVKKEIVVILCLLLLCFRKLSLRFELA